jgi:hypothetical protein
MPDFLWYLGVGLFGKALTPKQFMSRAVRQDKRDFCFTIGVGRDLPSLLSFILRNHDFFLNTFHAANPFSFLRFR